MKSDISLMQQDKAIKKHLKVIKKLQKRVHAEQRKKNQLASQLKRSQHRIKELEDQQKLKEEINK